MFEKSEMRMPVSMVILPQTAWEGIMAKLDEVATKIEIRNFNEAKAEWLESGEARKMLGISQSTWQNLRDTRKIPFSQYGRKIYVKKSDLQDFMDKNYITSK